MKRTAVFLFAIFVSGCAGIQQQSFTLADGRTVDYIHGKVDADGQTGVFRDAFVDGKPVLSHFGSGQSLTGQILQGAASSAMIAGGMVGAAAVLRPTRINESNDFNNSQGQAQGQEQGQASLNHSESNPITVQSTDVKNHSINANLNHNSNKAYGGKGGEATAVNANSNSNKAYGGSAEIGKVNSCNGIGSC